MQQSMFLTLPFDLTLWSLDYYVLLTFSAISLQLDVYQHKSVNRFQSNP